MRKEQILVKTKMCMKQLVEDLKRLEQGESLEGYELAFYMQGLEQGLRLADTDKITVLLSDVCRYTFEPYMALEKERIDIAIRYFRSSIMHLYLIAQSLLKDIGDSDGASVYVDELFKEVFTGAVSN